MPNGDTFPSPGPAGYRPAVTSSTPWWAVPAFTLAGVLLTLLWNTWTDRVRRQEQRATRWDPYKRELYEAYLHACEPLLDLDVWPPERTAAPMPAGPPVEAVERLNARIAFLAPDKVTESANAVASRASRLATAIEDIRKTTVRGPQGAIDSGDRERYNQAHREFTGSIDVFAVAARGDLGINVLYARSRRSRDRRQDSPQ
jgi:hypothetical protein